MPKMLGKVDPAMNKMTKDEIQQIHSRHKRETFDAIPIKKKEDFEVNMEEEDDEFAGPSLSLFQQESADAQITSSERNRKQNDIAKKVS